MVGSLSTDACFTVDLHTLPLGGYGMVLGVEWLGTLGPVTFDFCCQTMSIALADRCLLWASCDGLEVAHLDALTDEPEDMLAVLLEEFQPLFLEPRGLPPRHCHAHHIHLKPGLEAVAVRPYRYAHTQKDELERQCSDML